MAFITFFLLLVLAFLLGIVDASMGMGYGTLLTPFLIVVGFDTHLVVPAVLVSQLAGDFLAAFFHHRFKNVNLSIGSSHFKVVVILATLSILGSAIAVMISGVLPTPFLNAYIGMLFVIAGGIVLITRNRKYGFSWIRLVFLGSLAAFNKGLSGGGYGPLVTSGQILAGMNARSAIGIISLAEGFSCIVALLLYGLVNKTIDWLFSVPLSIGVALSAPLAAFVVRKIESRNFKLIIGIFTLLLGLVTILIALNSY
ncbi:MAG: sulfite exporter TauE/SafE family protein [Candidatus Bathyarchaeota archaeon]|jgi:hypothetical protein